MEIKDLEARLTNTLSLFLGNESLFGFEDADISDEKSFFITLQNAIFNRFKMGEANLNINGNAYEYFNITLLEYTLKNKEFKDFYFNMINKQIEFLNGKN